MNEYIQDDDDDNYQVWHNVQSSHACIPAGVRYTIRYVSYTRMLVTKPETNLLTLKESMIDDKEKRHGREQHSVYSAFYVFLFRCKLA